MSCYNCSSSEGSNVTLCPQCRILRAENQQTVGESLRDKRSTFRAAIDFIREEWSVLIGVILGVIACLSGISWVLNGGLSGRSDEAWVTIDPNQLFITCVEYEGKNAHVEDFDFIELKKGYEPEIASYLEQHPEATKSQAEIITHILLLRSKEACSIASSTCRNGPATKQCYNYVKTYMRELFPASA